MFVGRLHDRFGRFDRARRSARAVVIAGRFDPWPAARHWSTPRLRLLVGCGAAAGIASAYNAPIAGALFVAEIVLGSVAMEIFGPLVFSSVIATLTVRGFLGADPLYAIPHFSLNSNWEIVPYLLLGFVAGLIAPWFLRLLDPSEKFAGRIRVPVYLKMCAGGLIVGVLAVLHPEVCGNGYSAVNTHSRGQLALADRGRHSALQSAGDGGDFRLRRGRRRLHADAFCRREPGLFLRQRWRRIFPLA